MSTLAVANSSTSTGRAPNGCRRSRGNSALLQRRAKRSASRPLAPPRNSGKRVPEARDRRAPASFVVRLMPSLQTKRRPMTPARRRRIFEAHDRICGYYRKLIEGAYESDQVVPLALRGAGDDGGNTVPMHVDCHRVKTIGRPHHWEGGDARRIAKTRRVRMSRSDSPPRLRRSLTPPHLVRSPD